MFNVITHPAALEELQELPDELRGRMTRLIGTMEPKLADLNSFMADVDYQFED